MATYGPIRDWAVTEQTTNTASLVCAMPTHVTGDILIAFASKDGAIAVNDPGGAWTSQQDQLTAGAAGRMLTNVAASSSETLTLTSTTEQWMVVVVAVRNPHATTPVNTSGKTGSDDTSQPLVGHTGSTTQDNCLIFHFMFCDIGIGPIPDAGFVGMNYGDNSASSCGVAWSYKKTAGAYAAPNWYGSVEAGVDARSFSIAIRLADGTYVPPYFDEASPGVSMVNPLAGITLLSHTWEATAFAISAIGSKSMDTYDVITNQTDTGVNPYNASARTTPLANTAGTLFGGSQLNFASAQNFSSGYLIGSFLFATPRDYVDLGYVVHGGNQFCLVDGTNYKSWMIGAKGSDTTSVDGRTIYAVQPSQSTATHYAVSGTAPTLTSIDNLILANQNRYGAVNMYWNALYKVDGPMVLLGGSSSNPLTFEDLSYALNNGAYAFPFFTRAGSAGIARVPLKFGGVSAEQIQIAVNLRTIQFPKQSNGNNLLDWHVDAEAVGAEFHGTGSGDSIAFTNCVFTSDTTYYWRFNASHSGSATLDFSGTSVINANVTLRSAVALDGVAFIDCPTFTLNAATLSNCSFSNTKVAAAALADLEAITDSSFESSGTGHAIEVGGTAADIDLTNLTFTDYAVSDGSTGNEAIYVNIGSGTVNLTILGGTVPSVRTAGATVNKIINPVTLAVHVQDINTGNPLVGARVWVPVTSGVGGKPFNAAITSITRSGAVATVTTTSPHGLATNDYVDIDGAVQVEYNGTKQITSTGGSTFTYAVSGTPATPATGTITYTFIVISGVTNGSGDVSASYSWTAAQPVNGRVRTATGAGPFYKTAPVTGTISNTAGLSVTVQMIPDS